MSDLTGLLAWKTLAASAIWTLWSSSSMPFQPSDTPSCRSSTANNRIWLILKETKWTMMSFINSWSWCHSWNSPSVLNTTPENSASPTKISPGTLQMLESRRTRRSSSPSTLIELKTWSETLLKSTCCKTYSEARHALSLYARAVGTSMKAKSNSSVSVSRCRTKQAYTMDWIGSLVVKLSTTTNVMHVRTVWTSRRRR